jgi:hypothetical protein
MRFAMAKSETPFCQNENGLSQIGSHRAAVTTTSGNGAMVRVQSRRRIENQAKQSAASNDQKLPRLKRSPLNAWS